MATGKSIRSAERALSPEATVDPLKGP